MALIAWYPLIGNIKNQGTDNFTLSASPSFTTGGKIGSNCATNSSINNGAAYRTTKTLSLNPTSPISIFTWVYANSYTTTGANLNGLVSNHDYSANSGNGSGFGLNLRNNGSSFQVAFSAPYGTTLSGRIYSTVYGATTFTTGAWHHVGMVYDGTKVKLYLDGNEETIVNNGTNTGLKYFTYTATPSSNNTISIFSWSNGYTGYSTECKLNDARVYNHALSLKEVKELAKGLVLHYKFNFEDLYQPVEYIQSTGVQYIDTGFTANQDTKIEVKFNSQITREGDAFVFGSRENYNKPGFAVCPNFGGKYFVQYNSVYATTGMTYTTNQDTIMVLDKNKYYMNGTLYYTFDYANFTTPGSMILFACRSTEQNGIICKGELKMYYCKIYNNGVLVRDFIPCVRKTDAKPGLYDLVNNVFYTNSGTGDFSYPNIFTVVYTPVEYIDQVNPGSQATSEHNRCTMPNVVYTKITARVNVAGTGSNGGIMLSGDDGEWWKSWQGGGTGTVTMTPSSLSENTWTNVTWDMGTTYTGLKTSGWSDATNYWTPQHMRIAYITTYNGSTITGHFVPCVRNSDSKPGLYDTVTNTFFTNTGSGSDFTYPAVSIIKNKINDSSGYNNYPTNQISLSILNATNIGTNSISFNGSGSYLRLDHEVLTGSFTVSVWAKTSSTSNQCLFCDRGGTGTGPALFLLSGNSVRFDTVNSNFSTSFSYSDGNWHLYTCVYDGVKRYIYIDGVARNSTATTSIGALGSVLSIGGSYSSSSSTTPNGNWFSGLISDWRLYNTALSAADILELYQCKESIDRNGKFYCNSYRSNTNEKISFTKKSLIKSKHIVEGKDKVSLQGAYTELEYIKTNGNQIINTGVADTLYTTVDLDMQVDSGIGQYWYGSTQNSGSMMYNGLYNVTALEYNWLTISRTSNTSCVMTQRLDGKGKIIITMNGVTSTVNVGSTAPTGNMYIFGCNNGSRYYGTGLLCRYFKMYQNNILVRHFIPVKRNRDNAIGMFDLVTNTFYANSGSGSFTAGPEKGILSVIYTNELKEI